MPADIMKEYRLQTCRRCPLWEHRHTVVWGEGDTTARVMLVGRGPGAEEDAQGLPFIGPTGQLLRQLWAETGVDRKTLFLTYLTRCASRHRVVPLRSEVQACSPYLMQEIAEVRPEVIVALGQAVFQALTGQAWSAIAGVPVVSATINGHRTTVFGIRHPGQYLRMPPGTDRERYMALMLEDWRLVAGMATRPRGGGSPSPLLSNVE